MALKITNEKIKIEKLITDAIEQSLAAKGELLEKAYLIEKGAIELVSAFRKGRKVLICGNGGSAADSQHFAAELVGRFKKERKGLPAIALSTDTSILTAVGNDYGYEKVFSRQVEAHGNEGDILIGISTSGNSKNIIEAVNEARKRKMKVICLLGGEGGALKKMSDIALVVPAKDTPRVQECHVLIIHILCDIVEKEMFK